MHVRWVAPESHVDRDLCLAEIVASGDLTRSMHTILLEATARREIGRTSLAVASGTTAVWAGFQALRARREGSVVVPAFGFPATPRMAALPHRKVKVVDVAADVPIIDIERASEAATKEVATVAVTNFLDGVVDCASLRECLPADVTILEDSAGSLKSVDHGRRAAAGGDIAAVSLHVSKVIGGGEGGLVCADAPDLLKALEVIRGNGLLNTVWYEAAPTVGMNMRITELSAAVSVESFRTAQVRIETRRQVRGWYEKRLADSKICEQIDRIRGDEQTERFGPLAVGVDNRDHVLASLRANGVEARAMWGTLAHEDPALAGLVEVVGSLENAERWRDRVLVLPVHEAMTDRHVDLVIDVLERTLLKH